jgi:PHD/YefM family antitoxin component YafN of YafNO toxin-antitoxin module
MTTQTERQITLDEVRRQLAEQLQQLGDAPLTITDAGEVVGVLLSPQGYARIRRAQGYLQMLAIANELRQSEISVDDLTRAARADLETSGWS